MAKKEKDQLDVLACQNVLLLCLFVYLFVLNVLAFICTVVLSCNVVTLMFYLTLSYKREVWLSCTKSRKWPLLYYSWFLCVLYFSVVVLLCRSSFLIFDVFPSVLVCNPDLFFTQSIYEFRTVVYYCCLCVIDKQLYTKFNIEKYRLSYVNPTKNWKWYQVHWKGLADPAPHDSIYSVKWTWK